MKLVEEILEFSRKTSRCGKESLEGYTNWRRMSRQGEQLSDIDLVVLVRRMDKESNICKKVCKASIGVPE